jgi:NADH-quinone oxidoreductase subunit K
MTTEHYLLVGAALFLIGLTGVVIRRNIVVILMSIELMLNGVNLNLVAFSRWNAQVDGQSFALFLVLVAVAEIAVALALLVALFRLRGTVQADEIELLKW